MRNYLRSLDPRLPRDVWVLQIGGLVNSFGNGIFLPFLIIYLHNVRGIPLGIAGLVAAANSGCGFLSGFAAGTLSDRMGPRRVLIAALCVMAVAIGLFPLVHNAWEAFVLYGISGLGSGSFWPSQSSLVTGLTPANRRHSAFATQRLTMNLGVALGGLVGGFIASRSFTALAGSGSVPLYSLPQRGVELCQKLQAGVHFPVLCPARISLPSGPGHRPPFHVDLLGNPHHPEWQTPFGIELGYSAPVEPQSGPDWRRQVVRNRPCCFLHFTIFRRRGPLLPPHLKPAHLGGKRGRILYATGYGLQGTVAYFWSNHTWFFWHEHGVEYTASLHYFGPGTTRLLGRLLQQLRPADQLRVP